jgi:hypothetical protein
MIFFVAQRNKDVVARIWTYDYKLLKIYIHRILTRNVRHSNKCWSLSQSYITSLLPAKSEAKNNTQDVECTLFIAFYLHLIQ